MHVHERLLEHQAQPQERRLESVAGKMGDPLRGGEVGLLEHVFDVHPRGQPRVQAKLDHAPQTLTVQARTGRPARGHRRGAAAARSSRNSALCPSSGDLGPVLAHPAIKNGRQGAILPQSRTIVAADRVPVAHIPLAVGHKRLVLRAVPAAGRVARFLPSPVPARRRCNKRAPPQTSHRPAPDGASFFAPAPRVCEQARGTRRTHRPPESATRCSPGPDRRRKGWTSGPERPKADIGKWSCSTDHSLLPLRLPTILSSPSNCHQNSMHSVEGLGPIAFWTVERC